MNATALMVVLLIAKPDGTPALKFEAALVTNLSASECNAIGKKLMTADFKAYPTGHGISMVVRCEAGK